VRKLTSFRIAARQTNYSKVHVLQCERLCHWKVSLSKQACENAPHAKSVWRKQIATKITKVTLLAQQSHYSKRECTWLWIPVFKLGTKNSSSLKNRNGLLNLNILIEKVLELGWPLEYWGTVTLKSELIT